MIKVDGAPIDDDALGKIVEYLARELLSVLRPFPAGAGFSCSAKRNAATALLLRQ
jgi:pantoate kinase